MTESATLQVNVVEKGAKQVSVNLDKVARSCEEAAKQAGYFFDKQGRLRHSNGKFAKSNDEVANSLRKMKAKFDGLEGSLDGTEDKAKKTGSALDALKNIAASFITIKALEGAIKMADTMTVLRSQVNLVTKSQEESIAVQEQLFDISNRTFASLEATTTLYTRTARALQHLNKSSAETLKFTEAVNNAMRLGGVSATEQASALLQLSQALGSGVLQGDEFRSIAESAPILLDILSEHLGVMRGELKQMGSEGKITSEIIFDALSKAGDGLAKKAADMPVTFGQAMQVMNTHVMMFTDHLMNGSGIMTAVAAAVITLAENIEYILVPAIGVASVFAVKALSTAFMMLGGPMGIIAVVIGSLGLLTAAYGSNEKKLDSLKLKVKSAYDEIESMSKVKLDAFMVNLEIVISHDAKSYKDAQDKLKGMEDRLVGLKERHAQFVKEGKGTESISKYINKLTKDIILQKEAVENLGKEYNANLEIQKQGLILQGKGGAIDFVGPLPYKESKAFVEAMEEYVKLQKLIGFEGEQLKLETKIQSGELKNMSATEIERLRTEAQITDEMRKQQGILSGMKSTAERIMDDYVLSTMNEQQGRVYSLTRIGYSKDDAEGLAKIQETTDKNNKAKAALAKSLSGASNPFTDRLKSLSEEAAKLQAVNAEIAKYGEVGRYTAVQELTLELNNQNGVLKGISATQKQMLLDQAMLLDNQRQMNEVLMLGSDYTQKFSDMSFELELIGKTADEIEELRLIREIDLRTRLIANGATKETIELMNQQIAKIYEMKAAYDASKAQIEGSAIGGIGDGVKKTIEEAGTVRDQWAEASNFTFSSMADGFASFASGTKTSFSDMTSSILRDLSKILIKAAIVNSLSGLSDKGGILGAIGSAFGGKANGGIAYANGGMVGFSGGGFTGFGSKYEPAGIVHRGEVVFSQADVARHGGLAQVEKMRLKKPFANGGTDMIPPQFRNNNGNNGGNININITQYQDGSQEVDVTKDGRALENLVKVNVKKEIAKQMRPRGQLAGR